MGTTTNIDKIKERVQKLLNQAADREGTAEGAVFYEKAFTLMATYGFAERDLDTPDADDEVVHREFTFAGTYTDMQAQLLFILAEALHCMSFRNCAYGSNKVHSATVFGVKRHVDRVDILFSLLQPQMAAGARAVTGDPFLGVSAVVARRSYMRGFAATIFERLCSAESTVAAGKGRYSLALMDDRKKAEHAMHEFAEEEGLFFSTRRSKATTHGESFMKGATDGSASDLGQTRVRSRPALPC